MGLGLVAVVGAVIGLLAARGGSDDDGPPPNTQTELLSAFPERHDFGEVEGPRTATVTVAWVSGAPEFGLGIRFVEGGPPAFGWRGCAVRLGPQRASCELQVTFTPTPGEAAGARLAIRPQVEGAPAVRVDFSGSGAEIAEPPLELELALDPVLVAPGERTQAIIRASAPVEVALSTNPEDRVTPSSTSIAVQAGQPTAVTLIAGEIEGPVDIVAEADDSEASASLNVDGPPDLRLPEVIEEQTPLESTVVDYGDEVSAFDTVDGELKPTCTPPSGSTFPADAETTVTCEVADNAGNTESGTFTVVVEYTPVR